MATAVAFARQSNPSFVPGVDSSTARAWSRNTCVLRSVPHPTSFILHPSCVAFPFDALHVDCFAILRLLLVAAAAAVIVEDWRLGGEGLVVSIGLTAGVERTAWSRVWFSRTRLSSLSV